MFFQNNLFQVIQTKIQNEKRRGQINYDTEQYDMDSVLHEKIKI